MAGEQWASLLAAVGLFAVGLPLVLGVLMVILSLGVIFAVMVAVLGLPLFAFGLIARVPQSQISLEKEIPEHCEQSPQSEASSQGPSRRRSATEEGFASEHTLTGVPRRQDVHVIVRHLDRSPRPGNAPQIPSGLPFHPPFLGGAIYRR